MGYSHILVERACKGKEASYVMKSHEEEMTKLKEKLIRVKAILAS